MKYSKEYFGNNPEFIYDTLFITTLKYSAEKSKVCRAPIKTCFYIVQAFQNKKTYCKTGLKMVPKVGLEPTRGVNHGGF